MKNKPNPTPTKPRVHIWLGVGLLLATLAAPWACTQNLPYPGDNDCKSARAFFTQDKLWGCLQVSWEGPNARSQLVQLTREGGMFGSGDGTTYDVAPQFVLPDVARNGSLRYRVFAFAAGLQSEATAKERSDLCAPTGSMANPDYACTREKSTECLFAMSFAIQNGGSGENQKCTLSKPAPDQEPTETISDEPKAPETHQEPMTDAGSPEMMKEATPEPGRDTPDIQPTSLWLTTTNMSQGDVSFQDVAIDKHDNAIIVGSFSGAVAFGPHKLLSETMAIFVAKLDATGRWAWSLKAGGQNNAQAKSVALDPNGNVFITGFISGIAQFGSLSVKTKGGKDILIAKLQSEGKWLWAISGGSVKDEEGAGIAVDTNDKGNNNVYVTGSFQDDMSFDALRLPLPGNQENLFVMKVIPGGKVAWLRSNASGQIAGHDIVYNGFNKTISVVGEFQGIAKLDRAALASVGDKDAFVATLDENGNWQSTARLGGKSEDIGRSITVDEHGALYIGGTHTGALSQAGEVTTSANPEKGVFVAKYDMGMLSWASGVNASGDIELNSLALDSQGEILIAGSFNKHARFATRTNISRGLYDIFFAKLGKNGLWRTSYQAGGLREDRGKSIAAYSNGDALVIGNFKGIAYFGTKSASTLRYEAGFAWRVKP